MVTGPDGTPDLQVLTHRVKLLEHSLRDNISSFTESESLLHNRSRIRELVSEQSLLQKVEDLTANSVLHSPSMQQRQRLDAPCPRSVGIVCGGRGYRSARPSSGLKKRRWVASLSTLSTLRASCSSS
ncbi:hypothetical protein J4Q44_G00302960 [Coregonus suidteri]|uniref:Uncharacterized protein n=1 Tax=Coregonus suidteri TaxID=861788 RepID=A0AAN8L285_9TELE